MSVQHEVDTALARGQALVHAALQQSILRAAAEFQALDPQLDEFIEACSKAETVAPFFDPTLYMKNLAAGDPLATMKELAVRAQKFAAALPTECRVCHCTVENACEGGCTWAAPALCSQCGPLACRACGNEYRERDHVIEDRDEGLCPRCAVGG